MDDVTNVADPGSQGAGLWLAVTDDWPSGGFSHPEIDACQVLIHGTPVTLHLLHPCDGVSCIT